MSAFPVAIGHDPDRGAARNALAIIRAAGCEPASFDCLKEGRTRPKLLPLFAAAGMTVRARLRVSRSPAAATGLAATDVSDDRFPEAMTRHAILVNRPIARTPKGVRPCRPSETVLDPLDKLSPGPLAKEEDQLIIDAGGNRIA